MRSQPQASPASSPTPGTLENSPPPVVESAALLQGRPEVVILHNGREYRLRHTRLGKLILTA